MELGVQLQATDGEPLADPTRYRHLIGSLVYLVTRPDISHAVHIPSKFCLCTHRASLNSPPSSLMISSWHYLSLVVVLSF